MSIFSLLLIMLFIWVLPIIIVARSKKATGNEKLIWFFAVLFFSWLAFLGFIIAAPVLKKAD